MGGYETKLSFGFHYRFKYPLLVEIFFSSVGSAVVLDAEGRGYEPFFSTIGRGVVLDANGTEYDLTFYW